MTNQFKYILIYILILTCSEAIAQQESYSLDWVKVYGGSSGSLDYEQGDACRVDSLGYVYVVGKYFDSIDFDPGPELDGKTPGMLNWTIPVIYT